VHNRFDQLGKQIGEEALGPSGPTVAHDEISPDAQHADLRHEPDPTRKAERARLGLLGRLASILCLIEIYSHAPEEDEVLACVGKLIAFRQKRVRTARRQKRLRKLVKPFLWIIAAGRPTAVLSELGPMTTSGWPRGVYFSPGLFRVGIVVASELPRDRSTLLVRLMAAGPLLPHAIEDLSALPADAHERVVASQILLNLEHVLGKKPERTPEEQEFIVSMQNIVERLRDEGRVEEARAALRNVLVQRKLVASRADNARIDACTDPAVLRRWLTQAVVADSVAEALRPAEAVGSAAPRRRRNKISS